MVTLLGFAAFSLIVLLYGFLLYCATYRQWAKLHIVVKLVLWPIWLMWLVDVFVNATIGTLFFLEPPDEWTLSERLKRHLSDSKVARFIWNEFILPFDPTHLQQT